MKTYRLGEGKWRIKAVGGSEWFPSSVPGEVHLALLNAGRIPDPFVADNELKVAWVAETDWVFEGVIQVPDKLLGEDRVVLCFDGLDTLAKIMLNDSLLGETSNAFRSYSWEVKNLLKPGENKIELLFRSPVNYVTLLQEADPLPSPGESIPGGPYLRKAPCQWGWDWGPKLPPIGIWKDARLVGYSLAKLDSVQIRQKHLFDGSVNVAAQVSVQQWSQAGLQLCLTLRDPKGKTFATTCKVFEDTTTVDIEMLNPKLWWPNGYGEQELYDAKVTLRLEDETILDSREFQIGLRTLELRQEEDEYGESFTFVVNGVPIFAKGANWIPADSFPTRITLEDLDQLLSDAAKAHHNMIRVWGGGFYESDEFYDLCDKYGILVWQDFIFSCSIYPFNDPVFIDNVHKEVIDNVERIRHRASLAIWCGNNEMDWGWEIWGWSEGDYDDYCEAYKRFFYRTLPEWLSELDPDTPYWYSSPTSGTPFVESNSNSKGDAHYWEVWHGAKPFSAYREQYPRFMSEFGFQSLPPLKTIRTYASEDHWNLTDYMIEHHQRSSYASALFMGQMAMHYMMPVDFPSLVYVTMVLQSEGIRYGVEHWRRNRHRVSGTLYWQLNDCWPVASWSSLDYFKRWKALHYASRRFYAPLLLSIEDDETLANMRVHLTSDLQEEWVGEIRWRLMRLDGDVLDSGINPVTIDPLSSKMVFEKTFSQLSLQVKRETVFVAQLIKDDLVLMTQLATFVRNKHVQLVKPNLQATLHEGEEGIVIIELETEYLARLVELSLDDADVVFSDNYFDVVPGDIVQVTCQMPEGWTIDDVGRSLTVFSLYDSFA
ncbi:MAG: glycoside hydrolase family 2 protein [Chloroflexota bacterium]|nr:glycoside hydrolase family 2 protein [Chloroflexota bacterium]